MLRIKLRRIAEKMRILAITFTIGVSRTILDDLSCNYLDKFVVILCVLTLVTESDKRCILFLLFFIQIIVLVDKVGNLCRNLFPFEFYVNFRFACIPILFTEMDTFAVVHFIYAVRSTETAYSVFVTQKADEIFLVWILIVFCVNTDFTVAYTASPL